MPFHDKIVRHMLSLLDDSFQSASAPLSNQRTVGAGAAPQKEKSSSSNKRSSRTATTEAPQPTMFVLILDVLAILLDGLSKSGRRGAAAKAMHRQQQDTCIAFDPGSATNYIVQLTVLEGSSTRHSNSSSIGGVARYPSERFVTSRADSRSEQGGGEGGLFSGCLLEEVLQHVGRVWTNLAGRSTSELLLEVLLSLLPVARIVLSICRQADHHQEGAGSSSAAVPSLRGAVEATLLMFFEGFPFQCTELSVAVPGSSRAAHCRQVVDELNVCLCEAAFVHISSLDEACGAAAHIVELRDSASGYLLGRVRTFIDAASSLSGEAANPVRMVETERAVAASVFESLRRMVSRNTVRCLADLLLMLSELFGAFHKIPPHELRSVSFLIKYSVECLRAIVDRIEHGLGTNMVAMVMEEDEEEEGEEGLFSSLLLTVCSAGTLVLSTHWEQGPQLSALVDCLSSLSRGRVFSASGSPDIVEANGRAAAALFRSFWTAPSSSSPPHPLLSASASSSAPNEHTLLSGFARCDKAAKLRLLDAFLYIPFVDLASVSDLVLKTLTTSFDDLSLASYFLRLLYERWERASTSIHLYLLYDDVFTWSLPLTYYTPIPRCRRLSLSVSEFVNLLLSNVQRYCIHRGGVASCREAVEELSGRWLSHEVAHLLCSIGSSQSLERLAVLLTPAMQQWSELVDRADYEAIRGPAGVVDVAFLYGKLAISVIMQYLLRPWVDRRQDSSGSMNYSHVMVVASCSVGQVQQSLQLPFRFTSEVFVSIIWCLIVRQEGKGDEEGIEDAVMGFIAAGISPRVFISSSESGATTTTAATIATTAATTSCEYLFFLNFLTGLDLANSNEEYIIAKLRYLHRILTHRRFEQDILVTQKAAVVAVMDAALLSEAFRPNHHRGPDCAQSTTVKLMSNLMQDVVALF